MKYRNTIQRDLVIDAVRSLNHPTAEEVYDAVRQAYPAISRGTVYRNLGILVEQERLRRVATAGSADHFDITLEKHYHIVCRGCGRVVDAQLPYQDAMLHHVENEHGYRIDEHDILFRGYCPACHRAAEENPPTAQISAGF